MKIQISELSNSGDARGFSFSPPAAALDFLGRIADMHLASTGPGAVRGNHYHMRKNEAIVILPGTPWSLHWDEGEGTPTHHRSFPGSSAVLVLVSPGASHAVRNDGPAPLWLVTCSSEAYMIRRQLWREKWFRFAFPRGLRGSSLRSSRLKAFL